MFLIVVVLRKLDALAGNTANNSLPLSTLLRSFGLAIQVRPFLHVSVRVNHYGGLAEQLAVRASLEQFKGNWFAPILSLDGFLIRRLW